MSTAITKLWYFALKPGVTSTSPGYSKIWEEVIAMAATASKKSHPSPKEHHALYEDESDPSRALFISGFVDAESHKVAHDDYIANFMNPMWEFVEHESEIVSDVSPEAMPLGAENVAIAISFKEITALQSKGVGGWDVAETPMGFDKRPCFRIIEGKSFGGEVEGEDVEVRVFKKVLGAV